MASFAKFVTTPSDQTASEVSQDGMQLPVETDPSHPDGASLRPPSPDLGASRRDASYASSTAPPSVALSRHGKKTTPSPRPIPNLEKTIYSSTQPFNRPEYVDGMIRERISVTGVVRPMEPMEQINALTLDKEDIGLIKEAPVKRYLAGKAIWDRKFKRVYVKVQKERERASLPSSLSSRDANPPLPPSGHLKKSMKEEATRITKRVEQLSQSSQDKSKPSSSSSAKPGPIGVGNFDPNGRSRITDSPEPETPEGRFERRDSMIDVPIGLEGVWDLHGENPPPSSLAGRKDTVRPLSSLFSFFRTDTPLLSRRPRPANSPRSSTNTFRAYMRSTCGQKCVLFPPLSLPCLFFTDNLLPSQIHDLVGRPARQQTDDLFTAHNGHDHALDEEEDEVPLRTPSQLGATNA
jgi:hypothetical protein